MNTKNPPNVLLQLEADVMQAGLKAQARTLALMLAEMRALAALMPGQARPSRSDAEVEADFDNMPV